MQETLALLGGLVLVFCCLAIIVALLWNVFVAVTFLRAVPLSQMMRNWGKARDNRNIVVLEAKANQRFDFAKGTEMELAAKMKGAGGQAAKLRLAGEVRDDLTLWGRALAALGFLDDVSMLVINIGEGEFPPEYDGLPLLYDSTGEEQGLLPGTFTKVVCEEENEKKILFDGEIDDETARHFGQAQWPHLVWEAQQALSTRHMLSSDRNPSFAQLVSALTLGREVVDADKEGFPHSCPVMLASPPEAFLSAEAQGKRIHDAAAIWKHCSEEAGLTPSLSCEDITGSKLYEIAEILGVDEALDAYYSGVPLEDIIA